MKLRCKVVLLTGGSSGIGAAAASLLASKGIKVYAASRSGKAPENENIVPIVMDVNDQDAVKAQVDNIYRTEGRLDAIICNAGNGIAGAVEDTTIEEARYQFETNFYGALRVIDAALPYFRKQRNGRIITVTSVAGFIPIPYQAFYSSAKAALLMLTKALSLEVKQFGIQCCSILPGDTKTGFTSARKYVAAADSGAYAESMRRSTAKMEQDEQNGMPASRIAKDIWLELQARKMRMTVTPRLDYKAIELFSRFLPESWVMAIVGKLYS